MEKVRNSVTSLNQLPAGQATSSSLGIEFQSDSDDEDQDIQKIQELEHRLRQINIRRDEIKKKRLDIAKSLHDATKLRDSLIDANNRLIFEKNKLLEKRDSVIQELHGVMIQQQKYSQMSALNDAFFIWYLGPFGTINNFRLGNIRERPVEWTEINAALGQCVLVISIIASRAGIEFVKYGLSPLGSSSKVYKCDDKRTLYPLFTDGSFSFFPKRNFNTALMGFITCLHELGEHIRMHDPTLELPNPIDVVESTISNISVLLGNDEELWTRALKFMLADIKWIIAWYTKHYNNYIRGVNQT